MSWCGLVYYQEYPGRDFGSGKGFFVFEGIEKSDGVRIVKLRLHRIGGERKQDLLTPDSYILTYTFVHTYTPYYLWNQIKKRSIIFHFLNRLTIRSQAAHLYVVL